MYMFKYIKYKKLQLEFKTKLLEKANAFIDSIPDIVDLAKRSKELNTPEFQKLIAEELVKYMKVKLDENGD